MPTPFQHFAYQLPMRDWLASRDSAALFVSPGMGKSVVILERLANLISSGESNRALIVAPKRVVTCTWPTQIAKWKHSSWMQVADLRTPKGVAQWERGDFDIALINYDQLASIDRNIACRACKGKMPKVITCEECDGDGTREIHSPGMVEKLMRKRKGLPVDTIVFDELDFAKNPSSKRINAIRPYLAEFFPRRIGLTGTPCPNDYQDIFAQIRLLDDGQRLGKSFAQFRQNYFEQADYMGYRYKLRAGAKEIIDAKISDLALVMLGDDYLDIPETRAEDIEVTLPADARKAYKTLEKELLLELAKSDVVALNAAALATKLLQLTGGCVYDEHGEPHTIHTAKLKALEKLRKQHGNEPILVLVAYKHEMALVLKSIPGSRQFHEKDLEDWRAGKIRTWVANCQQMSHGIDGLQDGGRIAVWYTLTYSNGRYLQTNARLIRTGQSSKTIVYRLIAAGTIDEAVAESLREKDDTQKGLLNALKALQMLTSTT
jgi:SNF2 family DNA or RNA helicase